MFKNGEQGDDKPLKNYNKLTSFESDWLTIPNLGQFNLITGRNGVGKTRVLKELEGNGTFSNLRDTWTLGKHCQSGNSHEQLVFGAHNYGATVLLLDQVDFNLHYTSMKPMWEKLLGDAHNHDIQVFATTHSMECVRYFSELCTEYGYDGRLINIRDKKAKGKVALVSNTVELAELIKNGVELT